MGNSNQIYIEKYGQIVLIQKKQTYNIWQNSTNQQQIHQFKLHIQYYDQINVQKKLFQFRKNHQKYLVQPFYLRQIQSQYCNHQPNYTIFLQSLPYTLLSLYPRKIPFPDSIYLYHQVINGFKILFQHFGKFQISPNLIFINQYGQVKVWINPDVSKSEVMKPYKNQMSQVITINQIINVLNAIINDFSHPRSIADYIRQKSPSTLHEMAEVILNYKNFYNIKTKNYLQCLQKSSQQNNNYTQFNTNIQNRVLPGQLINSVILNNNNYTQQYIKPSAQFSNIPQLRVSSPKKFINQSFNPQVARLSHMTTSQTISSIPRPRIPVQINFNNNINNKTYNQPQINRLNKNFSGQELNNNKFKDVQRIKSNYLLNYNLQKNNKNGNFKIQIPNNLDNLNQINEDYSPINKIDSKIEHSQFWGRKKYSIVDKIQQQLTMFNPQSKKKQQFDPNRIYFTNQNNISNFIINKR